MNQDEAGFYDVYGPLVHPWWKTTFFYGIVFVLSLLILIGLGCVIYKLLHKKRVLTDLEQLILYRTLLDKNQDSVIMLYDYVVRVSRTVLPEIAEKNSVTVQELVVLIKSWHYKDLLDNSADQLISILMNAERVRFGKEDIAWDIVYDDIDYVIAMAKKIQSTTKK